MAYSLKLNNEYWNEYYKLNKTPIRQSSFADFVLTNYLHKGDRLADLGCGNGRDSIYFSKNEIEVDGYDLVCEEIDYLNETHKNENLNFYCVSFENLRVIKTAYEAIYARFSLHSVSIDVEQQVFSWASSRLLKNGYFFIEARSVKDEKMNQGIKISNNENIADNHYRRYSDIDDLASRLNKLGMNVIFQQESQGLSPYGDEDPWIIRIVATKNEK